MKKILFSSIYIFVFFYCSLCFAKSAPEIRVALLKDKSEVFVSVSGPYEIIDLRSGKSLSQGSKLAASKVVSTQEGLKIKEKVFKTDALRILPKRKASLIVNKRRYRGSLSIFKTPKGRLLVVNTLDIESYLKGVLFHEISHKWPINTIKAQAVASRTYAMYQKGVMTNQDYDVNADTSSQVYGGFSSEKRKTNRAVNFTYGEVLQYEGRVFPAYFHATCGGITEKAGELWNIDIEPLRGGRLCSFCSDSPHYYWKTPVSLETIKKKLDGKKYNLKGELKDIAVIERNPTGRVRRLKLTDEFGNSFSISAKDFRHAIGTELIRSTNFSIVFSKTKILFNGKGWGHGVGLCQWGAYGMARKGYNYKEILLFYYPGSKIVKI